MIISRTPHRISFFGGATDYPSYYLQHGGKVLGVTIDKYCYLNVRKLPPFFEHKHRVVYSKIENISQIDAIDHPSVRATLRYLNIEEGMSIHHDGDIPARSGMGSSSSFTVGLLNSILALKEKRISKEELARTATYIEQEIIRENVGSQDQAFAAYGGLNKIEFLNNGKVVVNPLILNSSRLESFEKSFMLYYTGLSRISSEIAGEHIKNTQRNIEYLHTLKSLVDDAYKILTRPEDKLDDFGDLLNETWKYKKKLNEKITTEKIDNLYNRAKKAGAIGGKLLGAGHGGFMVFYVKPEHQLRVKDALRDYLYVPFKFDYDGSRIIVYEPKY